MAKHEIFSCVICSKVFKTRSRFNQHSKTHSKPWKCDVCPQGFALRTDLNRHTKSKHLVGHQLFNCKECKRTFTRKDNLIYHQKRRHTNSLRHTSKSPSASTATDQAVESIPDWLLLTQSASSGNIGFVERLIHSVGDIDLRADDGSTALHCAARAGHTAILQVLIQSGAKVNVKNGKGHFPIYEAIIGGHLDCVTLLAQSGASLTELLESHESQADFPERLVRTGDCELVEGILAATSAEQRRVFSLHLLKAAARNDQVAMIHCLYKPEDRSPPDRQKLLCYAVQKGNPAAVKYLLRLCQEKDTVLRRLKSVAKAGWAEICKILLAASPAVNLDDALITAVMHEQVSVLHVLMSHQSTTLRQQAIDHTLSILMPAALWNNKLVSLRYLFAYDLKIAQTGSEQYDRLSLVELVRRLVDHGRIKIDSMTGSYDRMTRRSVGNRGRHSNGTLLHLAVEHNDLDLARYVVQHEAFDSSILEVCCQCNYSNRIYAATTALDLAQIYGHTEISRFLIAHGAINHKIAPKEPPRTEQNPVQPSSPNSGSDHEMQNLSDCDTDIDIDS